MKVTITPALVLALSTLALTAPVEREVRSLESMCAH
jgi:hypothetical protein